MRQRPPPFDKIYTTYLEQDPEMKLRIGQWFRNKFLGDVSGPMVDVLYNTTDFDTIFSILEDMYNQYQWPRS